MKPKYISTAKLNHAEWLDFRRQGIGGSDVAAILGMSPWRSPYSVWAEKTGRLPINDTGNEFTHWGTIMEPILAKEFEQVSGKKVYRQNKTFYRPDHEFLRANIDRDIAGEPGFLEIKTAMEYKSSEWVDDNIPIAYQLQVQHYMYVLDRPYVYFAYLVGGHSFGWKKVDRDQKAIDTFEPMLIDWWTKHILHDEEPDIDGDKATTAALKSLYPDEDGEVIELGHDINQLLRNREELSNSVNSTSKLIDAIANRVRQEMKDASAAETKEFRITNHKNKRGSRVLRINKKKED